MLLVFGDPTKGMTRMWGHFVILVVCGLVIFKPQIMLRRSSYFSTFLWFCVNVNAKFLFLFIVYFDADDSCHELTFNIGQNGIGATAATTRSFSIKVLVC